MKKIAFLDYSPIFAGAERVLYNMISHIDRNKYEPILIFPYPMEHQRRYDSLDCEKIWLADGLKWWMGSDRWKKPLKGTDFFKRSVYGFRIAHIIKKYNIEVLDINLLRPDVKMWVWPSKKTTPVKIVGHFRSHLQNWVAPKSAQKLFDYVACVSNFARNVFIKEGLFTNTGVLYDAIDISNIKSEFTKSLAKKKLGYNEKDILLVSVGQLDPRKGHDTAIRAFAKVAKKIPNAHLLIAGGGNQRFADELRILVNNLNIKSLVDIPGLQFENIQDIYRAADLSLSLTKDGEAFGLVPYESAILGTPCIAPTFGAAKEFIKDGYNGLLVDTNDFKSVVEKIEWSLNNLSICKKIVTNLNETIINHLTPERLSINYGKIIISLLESD